jgi:large subunit ribosomal protein L32e
MVSTESVKEESKVMTKEDVIREFTLLKGVGRAKAELLYNGGFDSLEKLKKASVKGLTKIKGVNENFARDIKDQLKEPETKPKETAKKPEKKVEKKIAAKPKKEKALEEKPKKPKAEKKEEEEEVETVEEEEEEYRVKKKPELNKDLKEKLLLRKKIKKRKPTFLREEWFRYKRIPRNWRRPDGITSKMRRNHKYRPSKVRVGFRGPGETRGLHSSGFEEIVVHNVRDLENIDPKVQAARIGSTVGTKKRIEIEKRAEELDVRILNM